MFFYISIFILGLITYVFKPKYFFFVWLSVQPFFMPIYHLIFPESNFDNFNEKYFHYRLPLQYLSLFILVKIVLFNKVSITIIKNVLAFFLFFLTYLLFQNYLYGFNISSYYQSCRFFMLILAPILLVIIDRRIRPHTNEYISFTYLFILIQFVFSLLSTIGVRLFPIYNVWSFDSNLISGSFARFNQLANYLSVFYLVISIHFINYHFKYARNYFFFSFLAGLLIALSGARVSTCLFFLTLLYTTFFYFKNKWVLISLLVIATSALLNPIGINADGTNADEGSGFERNLIGITELLNSDDITTGNTLSLSAYLLLNKFEHPIIGNGKSFRGSSFYDVNEQFSEDIFRVDSGITFMLVEYGLIGFSLIIFLFCTLFYRVHLDKKYLNFTWWFPLFFFFLLSVTEEGLFDVTMLLVYFVYCYSNQARLAPL